MPTEDKGMKVWILLEWSGNSCERDGCSIVGVFDAEEKATEARKKFPANRSFKWYDIEEHEVRS